MAITHSLVGSLNTTSNITNYTMPETGSINLPANQLIICSVCASRSSGAVEPTSIVTNGGTATWVLIDAENAGVMSVSSWRTMVGTAQNAVTLTLNHSGAGTGQQASVVAFDGVDTSGTNGSGAIGTIATSAQGTGTSSSLTVGTLVAANAYYGAFGHIANEATTHGMATELHDVAGASPNRAFMTEYGVGDNVVDASWATSSAFRHVAFEIVAAAAAATRQSDKVNLATIQAVNRSRYY